MPDEPFDDDAVRAAWDHAADAYAQGQASGRDYTRYEFFGPAQVAMVGDVAGARLLDLGCGTGYFAREMAARGAQVIGVDLSPKQIDHARATGPAAIDYRVMDAAAIGDAFGPARFDVVTSCMAVQDMPAPGRVLAAIAHVLAPGGRAVISIEHPCTNMPHRAWKRDAAGGKLALEIDRYFERGPIAYTWRWVYAFTTSALHVPLEDWFAWFRAARLIVTDLREPAPTAAALARRPELEDCGRVPYFLMFELRAA